MAFVLKGSQNTIDSDTDYSHNMQEQLLDSVFGLSTKLGRVPFSIVVLEDGSSKLHYCPDVVYGDIDEDVDPPLKGKRQRTGIRLD